MLLVEGLGIYDNNDENVRKEGVKSLTGASILVDKFLEDAIELDVDVLCDGEEVFIAGIMEHIEEAGVHSGDSVCIPRKLFLNTFSALFNEYSTKLALELDVKGLIDIQYAVKPVKWFTLAEASHSCRVGPVPL